MPGWVTSQGTPKGQTRGLDDPKHLRPDRNRSQEQAQRRQCQGLFDHRPNHLFVPFASRPEIGTDREHSSLIVLGQQGGSGSVSIVAKEVDAMDDRELRLECAKIAAALEKDNSKTFLDLVAELYRFVSRTNESKPDVL